MPTSTQRFRLVGEDDASRAFLQVAAASRLLKSNMDDVSSSVLGLGKLMGGTSLIPVVAGASAAIAELTTSLGAASGAAGIFGISAVGTVKGMLAAEKSIAGTQKTLDGLTKGTQAYRDAAKTLHDKQQMFNKSYGDAAKGYTAMKVAFSGFLDATGPVTQGTLGKGFELIASTLPKLVPVSNAAGKAIGGLIGDLSRWTEGPSFKHLLHFLETSGPKDITAFGHSIGNVFQGLGGLLGNFVGPGDHAAKTLEKLTERFDKWGHSKGVSQGVNHFLKYVRDNGPEISSAFKSLAEATPKIATALGKLGASNLSVTSKFLNLIAGLPQGAFDVVVTGLFGIAAASKAIAAVTGLNAILTGIGGVTSGRGLAGKTGGIMGGGALGVQHVWVDNMVPGGPGSKGVPVGTVAKGAAATAQEAEAAKLAAAAGAAVKAAGGTRAEIAAAMGKAFKGGMSAAEAAAAKNAFNFGKVGGVGGLLKTLLSAPLPALGSTGNQAREKVLGGQAITLHGAQARAVFHPDQYIHGTAKMLDALNAKLGKASQGMELVGHSAQRAFPGATKQVQGLSAKLQSITGSHATAAMELVGHSASKNFQAASGSAVDFRGKLNSIPSNKTVKVTADTSSAMAALQNIQAYQIRDKSFTVTRFTNATAADHVAHGGGGGGGAGGGAGGGMGSSRGFMGRPHVSWWDGTGAPLLSSIVRAGSKFRGTVNGRGAHVADFLAPIRAARQAGGSRLRNTIAARNAFAGGFQSFASSAFGASFGQDPTTGAEIAPTIGSILNFASGQRNQARMVKTDVQKLVRMGLSPALLKQLQAAGQAGIPTIQALAGASRSQIAQYNSLNKATALDLRSAGMSAGNRIFGQQIHKEEKHNAAVEHLLRQLVDMAKHHPYRLVAELKGDHIDLLLANTRRRKGKLQSDKKP